MIVLLGLLSHSATLAQSPTGNARADWETSCTIRKEKFDYILPVAMRANEVDMWIVIDRGRGTEPMTLDFAISSINGQGLFMFTDRGGERS